MKLLFVALLALSTVVAAETKEVTVNGTQYEIKVPKSASIDCNIQKNKERTECKKQPTEMPKISKPGENKPKEELVKPSESKEKPSTEAPKKKCILFWC